MERSLGQSETKAGHAVVLGGSGGVGAVICTTLAAQGYDVTLTYRGNQAKASEVVSQITESGGWGAAHSLVVEDAAAVAAVFDGLADGGRPIDCVVYAIGAGIEQPRIGDVSAEQWSAVMRSDADGFFNVVSGALPFLRSSRGSLVALTSAGLYRYPAGDILSVAPKGAIEALVRGVAVEEGRNGVRANCVALGVIEAGMFLRLKERVFSKEWLLAATRNTPLGRFGTPEEVAAAVAFLVSKKAGFITGQTLRLDGGYSI